VSSHRARTAGVLGPLGCGLACAALLLASCAAPLKLSRSADPLQILPPGELAYIRMDGETARSLAPGLVPADQGAALDPVLKRTTSLALGLGRSSDGRPAFDAVLLGSYPFRSAGLALGGSRGWKLEGEGFVNAAAGLAVAIPGPELVLATTRELGPLLAAARSPGANPLPPQLMPAAGSSLLLWIPQPFSTLAESLLGSSIDVPVVGLALVATERKGGAGAPESYDLSTVFVMRDADAARVYRPLLRLGWYGLVRLLFADEADELLQAQFSLHGELYSSSEVEVPAAALASALARVGGFQTLRTQGREGN